MKTVLIIDDEKELTEVIAMQIDLPGVKIIECHSSEEGLKIIVNEKVDLVVTDFKMPEMNGFELVTKVHDLLQTPPVFFMMTGFSDFNINDLNEYGIHRLYAKPGDLSEMISDIEKFFD